MRLFVISFFLSLGLLTAAPAAKKKSVPAPKSSVKSATKKSTAKRSTARRTRRGAGYMQGHRLPGQRTPTQERYKEIETALASKGYLTKEPDGAWGATSIAALKKFQEDQKLEPTGKLTSLSLIALGLGPKYETTASATQP
jgi:hypothetical protein